MRGRGFGIRALKRAKLIRCTAGAAQDGGSVLFREHDGGDTLGYGLVRWVGRAVFHIAIVVDPMKRTGHESWPAEWSQR